MYDEFVNCQLSTKRSAHYGNLINFKIIKLANFELDEVKLK